MLDLPSQPGGYLPGAEARGFLVVLPWGSVHPDFRDV